MPQPSTCRPPHLATLLSSRRAASAAFQGSDIGVGAPSAQCRGRACPERRSLACKYMVHSWSLPGVRLHLLALFCLMARPITPNRVVPSCCGPQIAKRVLVLAGLGTCMLLCRPLLRGLAPKAPSVQHSVITRTIMASKEGSYTYRCSTAGGRPGGRARGRAGRRASLLLLRLGYEHSNQSSLCIPSDVSSA